MLHPFHSFPHSHHRSNGTSVDAPPLPLSFGHVVAVVVVIGYVPRWSRLCVCVCWHSYAVEVDDVSVVLVCVAS